MGAAPLGYSRAPDGRVAFVIYAPEVADASV